MSDNKANYIEDANRTKSTSYYPELVGYGDFLRTLDACISALNHLDRIKKALFYGKPLFPGVSRMLGETCETLAIEHLAINDLKAVDILHGIIGKATEGCELLEALSRSAITGAALDFVNVAEEIGDGMWYDAILAKAIGVTFEEVQATNIAKLRKRYPEKYADESAIVRDLGAERAILAAGTYVEGMHGSLGGPYVEDRCIEAPKGWCCTRQAGHEGPCAAKPETSQTLYGTTDAYVWATEFLKVFESGVEVDRNFMAAWFANAIETAKMHEFKRVTEDDDTLGEDQ